MQLIITPRVLEERSRVSSRYPSFGVGTPKLRNDSCSLFTAETGSEKMNRYNILAGQLDLC